MCYSGMPSRIGAVHVATTRRVYKGKVYETHLLRRFGHARQEPCPGSRLVGRVLRRHATHHDTSPSPETTRHRARHVAGKCAAHNQRIRGAARRRQDNKRKVRSRAGLVPSASFDRAGRERGNRSCQEGSIWQRASRCLHRRSRGRPLSDRRGTPHGGSPPDGTRSP